MSTDTPEPGAATQAPQSAADQYGQETHTTYQQAGFGASVRRGGRPALVVVDLSRGFTEPAFPTGSDLTAEVRATSDLVEAARSADLPVIWTVISYSAAEASGNAVAWLEKATGMRALVEGSAEATLDPRLPHLPGDLMVVKKGASAFFGTTLAASLARMGCDTAVICGATTSGCVRATAVDAVQSGFPVLVPRQCVGDRAPGPHQAALFDIQAKYGDVVEQHDALDYLRDPPMHAPTQTTSAAPR